MERFQAMASIFLLATEPLTVPSLQIMVDNFKDIKSNLIFRKRLECEKLIQHEAVKN